MAFESLKEGLIDSIGAVNDKLKDSLSVLKDLKEATIKIPGQAGASDRMQTVS